MMEATGSCAGIENYSRYLTGRRPGEPPPRCSNTCPTTRWYSSTRATSPSRSSAACIAAIFAARHLAEYGFRLPSCMDNRPLRFEEWDAMRPQTTCVSATPSGWGAGAARAGVFARAGDPPHRPDRSAGRHPPRRAPQVDDLVGEIRQVAAQGYRALVTVLTKRMAEDLTEYLHEQGIRVR